MPNQYSEPEPYHDEATLRRLYHGDGLTADEIADKFGVEQSTISHHLSKNDIETRSASETREMRGTHHRPTKDGPHTSKEWLSAKYYDEHWSVTEMAEEAGVTDATIIRNMEKHGLERRPNYVTRVLRDPGAGFVPADARGYEMVKHSVGDNTYNYPIHRLIAIAEYGYDEVADKVVHHKNRIKWDNRIENLELLESASEHAKHHDGERERDEYGRYV